MIINSMKKISLSIVIILISFVVCFGKNTDECKIGNLQNYGMTIHDTIYFKISGLNNQADALNIDEILMKTGLVLSANTDFQKGICKVEIKDINYTEKIIEHIRSAWKQIGNPVDAEIIDPNKINIKTNY